MLNEDEPTAYRVQVLPEVQALVRIKVRNPAYLDRLDQICDPPPQLGELRSPELSHGLQTNRNCVRVQRDLGRPRSSDDPYSTDWPALEIGTAVTWRW